MIEKVKILTQKGANTSCCGVDKHWKTNEYEGYETVMPEVPQWLKKARIVNMPCRGLGKPRESNDSERERYEQVILEGLQGLKR